MPSVSATAIARPESTAPASRALGVRMPLAIRRAAPVVLVVGALVVYALGTFVAGSVAWAAAARGLSSSALASSPVAGKAP
jgi:hypothetical protein